MCELMGMSFAQPVSADFSVRAFAMQQEDNADGWGLAWYPDKSVALVKEPIPSGESRHMRFLENYQGLQSQTYIAHVRRRTRGGPPTHSDTHPFRRELGGREYCFAHNGTIEYSPGQLPLGVYHPVGNTDSEYTFCYLLQAISEAGYPLDHLQAWQWLYEQAVAINRLGKFNFLMSDGERLFAYHDVNAWKGLNFCKVRFQSDQSRRLEDSTIGVNLENLGTGDETAGMYNHGFVIATRALSDSGWHSFTPGELLVMNRGTLKFSSHRESRIAASQGVSAS